ncbi:MAG: efflux RND transporter periplasmic adaptor subunit [Chitinispirillales bacterium]|jgi:HlyD family secretion protein|nr:efflux RND transporter periplasmic adaptor subunit [Chitinispirillales bacterium]
MKNMLTVLFTASLFGCISKTSVDKYETIEVTRGSIEKVIVSSGTLEPVGSVEVGTQVSGTVEKVFVDFNDTVRAGQIIAEIDKVLLLSRLTETRASLVRAQALHAQGEAELGRSETLHEKKIISDQELMRYRTDYLTQKASLQAAEVAVEIAAANIKYATIRSPVKGTVIKRNIEAGQTVAASLSAPTLFIIAEDLKRMRIMAQVDETDIGKIRTNQEVRFSVQAYPDKSFTGSVSQIRLQPETIQNVVTYTVVISAANDEGILLPGMTANVEFVEERADDALLVPSSVFRFQAPEAAQKKLEEMRVKALAERGGGDGPPAGTQKGEAGRGGRQSMENAGRGGAGSRGRQGGGAFRRNVLWTLDGNNELTPVLVRTGITDGSLTSISGGEELYEGLKIVTGMVNTKQGQKQGRSLLPQQSGPPAGMRRM